MILITVLTVEHPLWLIYTTAQTLYRTEILIYFTTTHLIGHSETCFGSMLSARKGHVQ